MPITKLKNRSKFNKSTQLPTPTVLNSSNVTTPASVGTSYSREDTGYFPQYTPRSDGARSPEPGSMISSVFLNPQITRTNSARYSSHSSGGSSSDASEYLTPPHFQRDTDAPPYRSQRRDPNSLVILPKRNEIWTRRKNVTVGCGRPEIKPLGPREQSGKSEDDAFEGSVPSCKSKPSSKTQEELQRDLYSQPAPPVETRRWSSVELGAQFLENSRASISVLRPSYSKGSCFYRDDPSDMDLIEIVRAKLKARKAPWTEMETPAITTLRKASGASHSPRGNLSPINLSPRESPRSETPSPSRELLSNVCRSTDHRKPSAYLITGAEIDSIACLLEVNLKKSRYKQQTSCCHTPSDSHFQPQAPIHRPSLCNGFISVQRGAPADVATTFSAVTVGPSATPKGRGSGSTVSRRSSEPFHSTVLSPSSIHENLWELDNKLPTLNTVRSSVSADGFMFERAMFFSRPGDLSPGATWTTMIGSSGQSNENLGPSETPIVEKPFQWSESKPRDPTTEAPRPLLLPCSDSSNIVPMIRGSLDNQRLPGNSTTIPHVVNNEESSESQTSSKGNSPGRGHKGKAVQRTHVPRAEKKNPFIAAVTANLDVISFPALRPRSKTSDWISPLPDMSAPIALDDNDEMAQVRRQTLYQLDLDTGQSFTIMPNDHKTWLLNEGSSTPSNFHTETLRLKAKSTSFRLPDLKGSQRNVIIQHPVAHLSRKNTGDNGMGNAIGISSGRRKSSGHALRSAASGTSKRSPNPISRSESVPIVEALMCSNSGTDLNRKSLSHHAERQRIKAHSQMGERDNTCIYHSRNEIERTHEEVGKSGGNLQPALIESNSPYASVINNTIPGGITSLLEEMNTPLPTPSTPICFPPQSSPPKRGSSYRGSRAALPKPQYSTASKSPDRLSPISRGADTSSRKLPERLGLVKEKSPATVEDDCVGIYITMTGARRGIGGEGSEAMRQPSSSLCSVGCESHNCGGWSRRASVVG